MTKKDWGKLSGICWLIWLACMIIHWIPALNFLFIPVCLIGSVGWMIGLVALIISLCKRGEKKEIIIERKTKEAGK